VKRLLLLIVLAPALGCHKYVATAYGATGKPYPAPDVCQALSQCHAAGEKECFYPHGNEGFTCEEKKK